MFHPLNIIYIHMTQKTECRQAAYLHSLLLRCTMFLQGRYRSCHRVKMGLTAQEATDIHRNIAAHGGLLAQSTIKYVNHQQVGDHQWLALAQSQLFCQCQYP